MSTPTRSRPEPLFTIIPPLLNSANPWATTYDDLAALYACPHTGAVTIRTSLWEGFAHDPSIHQYTFFSPTTGHATTPIQDGRSAIIPHETSSLNTLGYSPIAFPTYLKILKNMSESSQLSHILAKPFIISFTGSVLEVGVAVSHLLELQTRPENWRWKPDGEYADLELMLEINLSCPNIAGREPPAYDGGELSAYLRAVADAKALVLDAAVLHVGIKTPPYTHAGQFTTLIHALEQSSLLEGGCPISFITATNTLGSCLVFSETKDDALASANGMGLGGLAGDALHPLALGNVRMIRKMLDESLFGLGGLVVIGVGGVSDAEGYRRMRTAGSDVVGVGTALGREGVGVFEKIAKGLEG